MPSKLVLMSSPFRIRLVNIFFLFFGILKFRLVNPCLITLPIDHSRPFFCVLTKFLLGRFSSPFHGLPHVGPNYLASPIANFLTFACVLGANLSHVYALRAGSLTESSLLSGSLYCIYYTTFLVFLYECFE